MSNIERHASGHKYAAMQRRREKESYGLDEPYKRRIRSIMCTLITGAFVIGALDEEGIRRATVVVESEVDILSQRATAGINIGTLFVLRGLPTVAFQSVSGKENRYPFDPVSFTDMRSTFSTTENPLVFVTVNPHTNQGFVITGVSPEGAIEYFAEDPTKPLHGPASRIPSVFGPDKNAMIKAAPIARRKA